MARQNDDIQQQLKEEADAQANAVFLAPQNHIQNQPNAGQENENDSDLDYFTDISDVDEILSEPEDNVANVIAQDIEDENYPGSGYSSGAEESGAEGNRNRFRNR